MFTLFPVCILLLLYESEILAIRCYQCDSNEDDSCPARRYFDTRLNAMIDCGSFLSHSPGTFCKKIYQESTGWNSWIKITRTCSARTDHGLAWSCRYWFEAQGIYKEVCYCQDRDGCNKATKLMNNTIVSRLALCFLQVLCIIYFVKPHFF
ncbi:hypothetical protein MN116_008101 [Schistosoma mekongi]|uniref:UPAR/Ly6 domain-containing protein qvr n=1 Tax=Schistosoma mekongi TaxID=38744 RepID=A0AAE2D1T3_SCHME|nr:hypothetical protein MN116_008101 [Schistosoma mekongi]